MPGFNFLKHGEDESPSFPLGKVVGADITFPTAEGYLGYDSTEQGTCLSLSGIAENRDPYTRV